MNPFFFHYRNKDVEAFTPKPVDTLYDIERSLDGRYRRRESLLMWKTQLSDGWYAFLSWEHRLFHRPRPLAHAHVKPTATRRHLKK